MSIKVLYPQKTFIPPQNKFLATPPDYCLRRNQAYNVEAMPSGAPLKPPLGPNKATFTAAASVPSVHGLLHAVAITARSRSDGGDVTQVWQSQYSGMLWAAAVAAAAWPAARRITSSPVEAAGRVTCTPVVWRMAGANVSVPNASENRPTGRPAGRPARAMQLNFRVRSPWRDCIAAPTSSIGNHSERSTERKLSAGMISDELFAELVIAPRTWDAFCCTAPPD